MYFLPLITLRILLLSFSPRELGIFLIFDSGVFSDFPALVVTGAVVFSLELAIRLRSGPNCGLYFILDDALWSILHSRQCTVDYSSFEIVHDSSLCVFKGPKYKSSNMFLRRPLFNAGNFEKP